MGGNISPLLLSHTALLWILEPKTNFENVTMIIIIIIDLAITEFKISYNNRYNYHKVGLKLLL